MGEKRITKNFPVQAHIGAQPIQYSTDTPKELKVMEIKTVGRFRDIITLERLCPELNWYEYEQLIEGRSFTRWYVKNRKVVNRLALTAPAFAMTAFKVSPMFLVGTLLPQIAIPVAGSFFAGHGVILLHMLIIGFLTLVVTTFLKFTGRGDLAPLVMFVGGGVILYEVLGLFKAIYNGVATFFNM